MPISTVHLGIGLLFIGVFLFGTIFPDLDKIKPVGFFKNKCWKMAYDPSPICNLPRGKLHNWGLWLGITLFALGCILHLLSDYVM